MGERPPQRYWLRCVVTTPTPSRLWRTTPSFRHAFTMVSLVWGAGLPTEAALRIAVLYLLAVDAAAGASTLAQRTTIALLVGWT